MRKSRRIRKLLVATRGEIAVRVIRAARELGIPTVAVCSDLDRDALHAELADERRQLPGARLQETYMSVERLLDAARSSGCDAVHPGYGLLSENAGFARACEEAGLVFVGPPSAVLATAGDKLEAKRRVEAAGVPTLPFHAGPPASLAEAAGRIGFPLLVKAAGGGGGRGIRRADRPEDIAHLAAQASREAEAWFGDPRVYLERFVPSARHVEVQVLADAMGRVVQLGERECSVQRRHQKLIEESPSPALDPGLRRALGEAAVKAARALEYRNAGTVELLLELDPELRPSGFRFLEVNARIQVEHPVTEAVTGQDIVAWQLRLASGEALPAELDRLEPRGHAIECRLCAERPPEHTPSSGRLLVFEPPSTPWVRFDTGYRQGDDVSVAFDSLLGKAVTWGPDRKTALRRMDLALETTVVLGIETNADFLRDALRHPTFQAGSYTTSFLEGEMGRWRPPEAPAEVAAIAAGALERSARRASGREAARAAGPWDAIRGPFFEARSP